MREIRDIGMIGVGRFGSYFAGQLERVGYRVHRLDAPPPGGSDGAYADARARACGSDLVIYAVPIRRLEAALLQTREALAPESLVMDICSVKVVPCRLLQRHLEGRAVVGTHPVFGPDSAPDRCAGQRMAICALPSRAGETPNEHAAAAVERVATRLGLVVVRCTPAAHDAQVARSQFLTHFIGRGAIRAGIDRVALSTRSHDALMDIVEVVGSDTMELFEDMAVFNSEAAAARAQLLAALQAIDRYLTERERAGPDAVRTGSSEGGRA